MGSRNKIRVIAGNEELLLVQWRDRKQVKRSWIPREVPVTIEEAERGVPAGVIAHNLEKLLEGDLPGLADRLEAALHARGLFSAADVERIPEAGAAVRSALMEAVKPLAVRVVELLRQQEA